MEDRQPRIILCIPDGHDVATALVEALAARGLATARAENVYDLTVQLAASPAGQWRAAVVAVDYFNRYEFDFFRIARQQRPDLHTVAVANAAFVDKAQLARVAGAWAVAVSPQEASAVAAGVAGAAGVAVAAEVAQVTEVAVVAGDNLAAGDDSKVLAASADVANEMPEETEQAQAQSLKESQSAREPLAAEGSIEAESDSEIEEAVLQLLRFTPPARRPPEQATSAPLAERQLPATTGRRAPSPPAEPSPDFVSGNGPRGTDDLLTPEEIAALLSGWDDDTDDDGDVAGGRHG